MARTELLTAPISPDQISLFLTSKLHPALPYSLPLYRRCQFHLKTIDKTPSTAARPGQPEVWVAYIDKDEKGHNGISPQSTTAQILSSTYTERLLSWLSEAQPSHFREENSPREWLAAHIDLTNPAETQVFTFGSWESTSPPRGPTDPIEDEPRTSTRLALFRALIERIRAFHTPALPDDPPQSWLTLLHSGKLVSKPYRKTKVLFGGTSEPLWPYLQDDVIYGPVASAVSSADPVNTTCITRQDKPYLKYIIPLDKRHTLPQSSPSPVPAGLHFGRLSDAHLQLMLDRSVIPRTLTLLKTLVSVGLFPDDDHQTEPVAWGILGKDATVASLHTEPAYRGKGLAEHVTRELIRLMPETCHSRGYSQVATTTGLAVEDGDGDSVPYAHADVSPSNGASRRVFEKLGGTVQWRNAWIEVDLERSPE